MLLRDKSAIVTGGAAGIGRAICLRMAEEGARVIIADRDEVNGGRVESEIRAAGGTATFVATDVADIAAIDAMVAKTVEINGRIDILVNNAGVTKRIPILDIGEADWDRIQDINTRGTFFCLQRVARHMKERNYGRVVNISSVSGKGVKGSSNASYAVSKAAGIVLARIAANELGRFGINVNTVVPGTVNTDLIHALDQQDPGLIEDFKKRSARGELAEPVDIANAVIFLSSPLADSITGQSINVDNGVLWD
ncbi:SDR family NAD(P)-dependent oxidoreductase [Nocardia sp. NPDC004068]|uniref:SDR family NAD(P)-dependent oxidoreductase n=1 Tax=Nocardia sp. NPDC004068 TaxID=3364303 RepID=UPI0036C857CC